MFWFNFQVIRLLILVADLLVYAFYLSLVALTSLQLRVAPYVRVIIFILNIRELRAFILILTRMIGIYLNVLALWLLFLLFASWVAYVTFEDTQEGKLVFTSYGTTLHQMFVLFTISNNPDVWILACKASRWCYFFYLFNFCLLYFDFHVNFYINFWLINYFYIILLFINEFCVLSNCRK